MQFSESLGTNVSVTEMILKARNAADRYDELLVSSVLIRHLPEEQRRAATDRILRDLDDASWQGMEGPRRSKPVLANLLPFLDEENRAQCLDRIVAAGLPENLVRKLLPFLRACDVGKLLGINESGEFTTGVIPLFPIACRKKHGEKWSQRVSRTASMDRHCPGSARIFPIRSSRMFGNGLHSSRR